MISITFDHHAELIALAKALEFVKFRCHDPECSHLAGSPYIGNLYKNVLTSLEPYYKRSHPQWSASNIAIEDFGYTLDAVRYHITTVSHWHRLDVETKLKVLREYLNPFCFKEETLVALMEFGNSYHEVNRIEP